MGHKFDGSPTSSPTEMITTTTTGTTQQIGQVNITVGLSVSGIGGRGGRSNISVTSSTPVIILHLGLATTGAVAVAVMVCTIPTTKLASSSDSVVANKFHSIFAVGKKLGANSQIPVVTGSQGEGIGSLEVHNHTGSDIDFIGGEDANFIGIIGPAKSVGFVNQAASHEGTVTVKDGTHCGIDGQRSAGEDQFGDLWAEDFNRTVGSVTRRSVRRLALSPGS